MRELSGENCGLIFCWSSCVSCIGSRLVAVDRSQRSFHRTKPETGGDSLLNEPVVLLKNIVEIRGWSTSAAATQLAAVLQFRDGPCVRWMPVDIDYARSNLPRAMESKAQEKLCCGQIAVVR